MIEIRKCTVAVFSAGMKNENTLAVRGERVQTPGSGVILIFRIKRLIFIKDGGTHCLNTPLPQQTTPLPPNPQNFSKVSPLITFPGVFVWWSHTQISWQSNPDVLDSNSFTANKCNSVNNIVYGLTEVNLKGKQSKAKKKKKWEELCYIHWGFHPAWHPKNNCQLEGLCRVPEQLGILCRRKWYKIGNYRYNFT